MTLNNVPYEQIELGWAEQSIGSGETAYYWFTEWQQGNSFPHRVEKLFNSSTGACNPTLGGYVLMKVNNYPLGTTNWTFDVSCDGGSTWHTVDTLTNVLDATGNPQVETGKKGDTTGASDDHQSLQWKDANGNYSRWNAAHCWSDSIDSPTNWKGNVYSTSPFDWQTLSNGQGTEC